MVSINGFHARALLLSWCAVASIGVGMSAEDVTIPRVPNPPLSTDLTSLPGDLRAVAVPGPSNLGDFVKDPVAALALGKALFWDMQVGSDGIQACASCHFRAGADPRSKNQVSPGLKHAPVRDLTYSTGGGPNAQLLPSHFPLSQLAIPGVRGDLDAATDSNDAVSSQGVHHLADGPDPDGFSVAGLNTRRVEPRNTPSVINAVFNHRQFWDGRAENVFNGVNHLGTRDPNAKVMRADDPRTPVEVRVELVNSSLASQAVAPIVSTLEMSAPGRSRARRRPRPRQDLTQDLQADSEHAAPRKAAGPSHRQRAWRVEPLSATRSLDQELRRHDQAGVSRTLVAFEPADLGGA